MKNVLIIRIECDEDLNAETIQAIEETITEGLSNQGVVCVVSSSLEQ